jgi:Divergent InlB B-repeat domain
VRARSSLVWVVGAFLLVGAGCRNLTLPDKKLACSAARTCPSPYQCHKDNFCYRGAETDAAQDQSQDQASPDAFDGGPDLQSMDAPGPSDAITSDIGTIVTPKVTVTIQRSGNGSVTGTGVNCTDASCAISLDAGSSLILAATAATDSDFKSWSGCDTTADTHCTLLDITTDKQVSVTFATKGANFVIIKAGNGTGTVAATWAGGGSLSCGTNCSGTIPQGTQVTLQATPAALSSLTWGAPCSGAGPCVITVGAGGATATATFTLAKYALTVNATGAGTVTGAGGISCATFPCTTMVDAGSSVTLTATPAAQYDFAGWTGCSSAAGAQCTVTSISAATPVSASFTLKQVAVTIQHSGNGSVTGTGGINCTGVSCVANESIGTTLSLMAVAAADSHFTGWTGDCTGTTNPCVLTSIAAAKNVTAAFTLNNASFTISKAGTGSGTVSATWPGGGNLSCGATCSASIAPGTVVTLTATPGTGSAFTAWSSCAGTGTCTATVVAGGTTVGATFTINQFLLSAAITGPAGTGSVLSATAGVVINCGSTCAASVNYGTVVQLVATPSSSGAFAQWTGCDSVTGTTCNVSITKTTLVTASFTRRNGFACGGTGDCSSKFCVSGICCGTACDGACDASCGTGICAHQPARTLCGTSQSTQPGHNDLELLCDAVGNCTGPKVLCGHPGDGNVFCQTGANACCDLGTFDAGSGTSSYAWGCYAVATCDGSNGANCNDSSDCPLGQICTAGGSFGIYWNVCRPAGSGSEYCNPNSSAPQCLSGGTCHPENGVSDNGYCL